MKCSVGEACKGLKLGVLDFHRRSRRGRKRSSRCKYCAAAAQRRWREAKSGKPAASSGLGLAERRVGKVGPRDAKRMARQATEANTRRPAKVRRDEEVFSVRLPTL